MGCSMNVHPRVLKILNLPNILRVTHQADQFNIQLITGRSRTIEATGRAFPGIAKTGEDGSSIGKPPAFPSCV